MNFETACEFPGWDEKESFSMEAACMNQECEKKGVYDVLLSGDDHQCRSCGGDLSIPIETILHSIRDVNPEMLRMAQYARNTEVLGL